MVSSWSTVDASLNVVFCSGTGVTVCGERSCGVGVVWVVWVWFFVSVCFCSRSAVACWCNTESYQRNLVLFCSTCRSFSFCSYCKYVVVALFCLLVCCLFVFLVLSFLFVFVVLSVGCVLCVYLYLFLGFVVLILPFGSLNFGCLM